MLGDDNATLDPEAIHELLKDQCLPFKLSARRQGALKVGDPKLRVVIMTSRTRRLVDLSVTLDNNPYTDPPPLLPKIDYVDHQTGAPELLAMFPGLRIEDLPGSEGWAAERLQITTHSGTHMDAPWHYASTTDGGKPAYGIDELPLEWCLRPRVKLDFRHLPDGMW